jgi:hypothetical protein
MDNHIGLQYPLPIEIHIEIPIEILICIIDTCSARSLSMCNKALNDAASHFKKETVARRAVAIANEVLTSRR